MKNLLIFTCLFLFLGLSNSVFAQDVLLLKSGEEIKVLVNEISTDVIKYKKFENPDGPLYVIEKIKVVMITYKNGSKDVFSEQPAVQKTEKKSVEPDPKSTILAAKRGIVKQNGKIISKSEVRSIMAGNSVALNQYKSGTKLILSGEILGYAGLGIVLIAAVVESRGAFSDNSAAMVGIIGGVACLGSSMAVTFTGRNKIKKSVENYNSGIKNYSSYDIGLGITGEGFAFILRF